jgi:hypothetical protein
MHRLGFEESELLEVLPELRDNDHISIASVFSHLAGADEALHHDFSQYQLAEFIRLGAIIENDLKIRPLQIQLRTIPYAACPMQAKLQLQKEPQGKYGSLFTVAAQFYGDF